MGDRVFTARPSWSINPCRRRRCCQRNNKRSQGMPENNQKRLGKHDCQQEQRLLRSKLIKGKNNKENKRLAGESLAHANFERKWTCFQRERIKNQRESQRPSALSRFAIVNNLHFPSSSRREEDETTRLIVYHRQRRSCLMSPLLFSRLSAASELVSQQ